MFDAHEPPRKQNLPALAKRHILCGPMSYSFDNVAVEHYDRTRAVSPELLTRALDAVQKQFPPETYGRVFEPGIGTGRIAIPMARRGYHITGVDISPRMMAVLRAKLAEEAPELSIEVQDADVTDLPFPPEVFDMVTFTHVLHLISDWRQAVRELFRVLKGRHPILSMVTRLELASELLDRYREMVAQHIEVKNVGIQEFSEYPAYVIGLGGVVVWEKLTFEAPRSLPLADLIAGLESRSFSVAARTPLEVHKQVMPRFVDEVATRFGSIQKTPDDREEVTIEAYLSPA